MEAGILQVKNNNFNLLYHFTFEAFGTFLLLTAISFSNGITGAPTVICGVLYIAIAIGGSGGAIRGLGASHQIVAAAVAAGAGGELHGEAQGPRTRASGAGSVRGTAWRTARGSVTRSCASGVARRQLALSGVLDDRSRKIACCLTFVLLSSDSS